MHINDWRYFFQIRPTVPVKDQTAPVITDALLKHKIFIHGTPFYLLTDQGSNVDGDIVKSICNQFKIKKAGLQHTTAKAMDLRRETFVE